MDDQMEKMKSAGLPLVLLPKIILDKILRRELHISKGTMTDIFKEKVIIYSNNFASGKDLLGAGGVVSCRKNKNEDKTWSTK
jgi:hypothetical protein